MIGLREDALRRGLPDSPRSCGVVRLRSSRRLLFGILFSSFLFLGLSLFLWHQRSWEQAVTIFHNFVYSRPLLLLVNEGLSSWGMSTIALIYAFALFRSLKTNGDCRDLPVYLLILLSFLSAAVAGHLLKLIVDRLRPAVELSDRIVLHQLSSTSSFPSGHTTNSMALALPFLLMASGKERLTRWVKGTVLVVACGVAYSRIALQRHFLSASFVRIRTVLVAYSRIALQRHFLSDVLAGVGVGLLFLYLSVEGCNVLQRKRPQSWERLLANPGYFPYLFLLLAVLLGFVSF